MSIDRIHGEFSLSCDICGEDADESFEEFSDAVEYKKNEGWRSKKIDGEWNDVCPECNRKGVKP